MNRSSLGSLSFIAIGISFAAVEICCSARKDEAAPGLRDEASTTEATVVAAEASHETSTRTAECKSSVPLYEGSISVAATDYHSGDQVVAELDRVVSGEPHVDFTLQYPFKKPFTGSVGGPVTLRRIIDAVRSGMRHMYEGSTQRDIPNLDNKEVTGPYGRSFHVIGDLVIEHVDLCEGPHLEIAIGS